MTLNSIYTQIILIFVFGLFYGLPSTTYNIFYAFFLVAVTAHSFVMIFLFGKDSIFNQTPIILFCFIYLLIVTFSIIAGGISYEQPLIYGFLAARGIFLLFAVSSLILLNPSIDELKKNITFFCKIWVIIVIGCFTILSPEYFVASFGINNPFVSYFIDFSFTLDRYRFKFNYYPVLFLFSILLFIPKKKFNDVLFLILCVFVIVFINGGRILLASSLLLVFIYITSSTKSFALSLLILPFLLVTFLFNEEIGVIDTYFEKILLSVKFLLLSESITDISLLTRSDQINIYLNEQWPLFGFFGNGVLSSMWKGGYESFYGRFHPSDIGVLGVIFVYGFCGILMFFTQMIYLVRIYFKERELNYGIMFLPPYVIHSLLTGHMFLKFHFFIFLLAIIWLANKQRYKNSM